MKGLGKRFLVNCVKCGYEWLSYSENPKRCALCNNPNPKEPKVKHHKYEATNNETNS